MYLPISCACILATESAGVLSGSNLIQNYPATLTEAAEPKYEIVILQIHEVHATADGDRCYCRCLGFKDVGISIKTLS